jgi:hypothetical protein
MRECSVGESHNRGNYYFLINSSNDLALLRVDGMVANKSIKMITLFLITTL